MAAVVKKFTHTLYYGTGSLIKDGDRHHMIRIRFPSMDHAWQIINDLNGRTDKLYIPVRKDGVTTFAPECKVADNGTFPVRFEGVPEYAFADEPWPMVKFIFNSETNEEEFWTHLIANEASGATYIPNQSVKSFWLPYKASEPTTNQFWVSDQQPNPQYPVYVISKGRHERRLTADALHEMNCPFYLVIESNEAEAYKSSEKYETNYLVMPPENDNLGQGSIPVRNFLWQHAIDNHGGLEGKHWCLDDNMDGFYRFHKNTRIKCKNPIALRQCEILADKYDNVYMAGLQYKSFVPEISTNKKNVILNTRIYSCILIRNDLDVALGTERWRGRYNEDTDLSLRVLKAGGANFLCQNFLADKQTTMSCKGGNTSGIYQKDGLQKKLDSLIAQHPDCVKGTFKFKKVHHDVDYSKWANNTLFKDGREVPSGPQRPEDVNEFGLKLWTDDTMKKPQMKKAAEKVKLAEKIEEHIEDKDPEDAYYNEDAADAADEEDELDELITTETEKDKIIEAQQNKIEALEATIKAQAALLAMYM